MQKIQTEKVPNLQKMSNFHVFSEIILLSLFVNLKSEKTQNAPFFVKYQNLTIFHKKWAFYSDCVDRHLKKHRKSLKITKIQKVRKSANYKKKA